MKKRNRNTYILVFLILVLGMLLLLNRYLDERTKNENNNKAKTNNTVEKSDPKKEDKKNKEEKKDDNNTEKIETENKSGPSSDENVENTNENKNKNKNVNDISLELLGEDEVTINKGSKYKDAGFKAVYSDGSDASDMIEVDNSVDTSKEGTYTISYYVGNKVVIRRVIVK